MKSEKSMKELEALKDKKEKEPKTVEKTKFSESDDMSLLIKKKKNQKAQTNKNSCFRNNYKKYQYDYEEDFYEPRY